MSSPRTSRPARSNEKIYCNLWYTNEFYFCMSLSGLIWIPTRALVLLGWFFTRRALRSTSTPKRGSQVRTGPFAGGSRIRTIGPAEDPRRRRDIGSRRAAFSVAASRADTSPSLETLVVSRGTDGSIRLVPAVSQTNSEGCEVG